MEKITVREDGTLRVQIDFPSSEEGSRSRTKPEFYKDCNINVIMKKYRRTGILGDPLSYREGVYGDFSSGQDFADRMRQVVDMQRLFASLPAHIRSRFKNDPQELVDFVVKPENDEECFKLGLKVRPAAPAAVSAEGAQPPATPVTPPPAPAGA